MRPSAARRPGRALRAARSRRVWLGSGRQRPMWMGVGLSARCTRRWRGSERSRASRHAARRDHLNGSNVTAAGRPGRIRPRRRRGCRRLSDPWGAPGRRRRPRPHADRAGTYVRTTSDGNHWRRPGLLHRQRDRAVAEVLAAADERATSPVPPARVVERSRSKRVDSSVSAARSTRHGRGCRRRGPRVLRCAPRGDRRPPGARGGRTGARRRGGSARR
jgi:hypothetical protein